MQQQLYRIRKTFVASIVGLVAAALLAMGGVLIVANVISYDQQVSASQIDMLTAQYPDVSAYIDSQKAASPHFTTLATLVKQEQQRKISQAVLWASIPLLLGSMGIGYVIAKRLLQPVSESYRTQDRFIQDAAHELRNPLAALSATIEAAHVKKTLSQQDFKTILNRIDRQTKRLVHINEDLLFLQKAAEAFNGTTDLSSLTREVAQSYQTMATEKSIRFAVQIEDGISASIRPKDFQIVTRNLIDNAVKYTPANGKIVVQLAKRSSEATLTVTDTGVGIPARELDNITTRFYRASNTGGIDGSGLGLSLVQKVVDSYGGELTFTSKEKRGTKVTFRIALSS